MYETPIRSDRALIALFALVTRSFFLGLSLRGGMLEMRTYLPSSTSYFADLTTSRHPCPLYKLVDDCTMFDILCSHTRMSMLQDSVDIIANWTTDNDMCINASKTKQMIICLCRDEAHEAALLL